MLVFKEIIVGVKANYIKLRILFFDPLLFFGNYKKK